MPVDESLTVVPLPTGAAYTPRRPDCAGAGNAPHEGVLMTVKFGGYCPFGAGVVAQGQGVPDPQVLHISGAAEVGFGMTPRCVAVCSGRRLLAPRHFTLWFP